VYPPASLQSRRTSPTVPSRPSRPAPTLGQTLAGSPTGNLRETYGKPARNLRETCGTPRRVRRCALTRRSGRGSTTLQPGPDIASRGAELGLQTQARLSSLLARQAIESRRLTLEGLVQAQAAVRCLNRRQAARPDGGRARAPPDAPPEPAPRTSAPERRSPHRLLLFLRQPSRFHESWPDAEPASPPRKGTFEPCVAVLRLFESEMSGCHLTVHPRPEERGALGSHPPSTGSRRMLPREECPSMNFEQGIASIQDAVQWAAAHDQQLRRNEAQTRRDLIDRIIAALSWTAADIHVEVHYEGTFSDYELGSPSTRLLLEAKREGTYFSLPAGWKERIAKIDTIKSGSQAIAEAVDQALSYALQRGIPYAAVSNGWQLVAFMASRTDGVPPLSGDALVFPSLESMADDFRTLWDNLSQPGVLEEALSHTLGRARSRPVAPRLAGRVPNYPGVARRDESQQTLQILGSVFVEDLALLEENERRFLMSCYSPSGALSQYALVSKEILRTRYSLLFDDLAEYTTTPASSHTGLDPNLVADIAAASLKQRPIILLGDVGVGKSTFIKNLIHVEAREQLEQAIVFYLDFGKRPAITNDLASHVGAEIKRQLLSNYGIDVLADSFVRGVYHGKLEQFRSSLYGPLRDTSPEQYSEKEIVFLSTMVEDIDEHLKFSLDHISKAHRKQVVIFLDNVDQRASEFQNELFVIAQTMAESWPVTVFLALRPETFYESRRTGSLSAYQPRAFTISPPRVEIVLKRRLAYALELLKDGGLRTSTGVEITVDLSTLTAFMETVLRSLNVNAELVEFLENVSNGNIRDALGYLEMYIGSPHVDLRRVVDIINEPARGRYIVPIQDLVRSVILGDGEYYDPLRSPIGNLFFMSAAARAEHFVLPLLIEFLNMNGSELTGSDGFVEATRVYEFLQSLGYSVDVISLGLTRALEWRFISRSGSDRKIREEGRAYRVTPCGMYITRKLATTFAYLDSVIDDTPIADLGLFGTLSPMSHDRELDARLRRVERFIRYLDESWDSFDRPGLDVPYGWPQASLQISVDVKRIRERMSRR
jgi:GTPase SAR1 family protein